MANQINFVQFSVIRPLLVTMLGAYFDTFHSCAKSDFYPGDLLDSLLPSMERGNKVETIKILRTGFQAQDWKFEVRAGLTNDIRGALHSAVQQHEGNIPQWRVIFEENLVELSTTYRRFGLKEAKDYVDFLWNLMTVSGCMTEKEEESNSARGY